MGVLEVTSIEIVELGDLDDAAARDAGLSSREELVRLLSSREGDVFCIGLRYVGPDPRVELRERLPDQAEIEQITARLSRLDRGPQGPWTEATLEIIDRHPERRAEDLAGMLGRVKKPFKLDVRKLKELGLTESLRVGYRLSPRGRAVLSAMSADN
jgi:hypothetical protein